MTLSIGDVLGLTTDVGPIRVRYFEAVDAVGEGTTGMAITSTGEFGDPVPVRMHSSCSFSEVLHSDDCDCATQLAAAMRIVVAEGGLLVYSFDEGRGAGLGNKIRAMRLQASTGIDTAGAFTQLGLVSDVRSFDTATQVVRALVGERPVEVLTNNPRKVAALADSGVAVVGSRELVFRVNDRVASYLDEKARVLGHLIGGPSVRQANSPRALGAEVVHAPKARGG